MASGGFVMALVGSVGMEKRGLFTLAVVGGLKNQKFEIAIFGREPEFFE